ncbi:hypothetical protein IWW37_005871 [Coemansia sp. RSA 2050]|nr:hypothetical protein IWW37_005871 [Coemansia sp. RSA 2050]KAJ2728806.1 hypothetical protein IW152_005849 [Coemansia sp. BCRC 34962]
MSVVSTNPFALLPDDATDSFVNVVPSKAAAKAAPKKVVPVTPAADRATPSERASRGTGYPSRGARRTVASTRAPGAAIVDSAPAFEPREKDRSRPIHQSQRGRGSVRGRGRQFDRHSATGLVDSEKKEKQGWLGDEKALVQDGAQATEEAKKDNQEAATPAVEEEPEEVIKTLDDYLKERESASVDAKRTLRKANEARVDQSQLKNQMTLDKKEEDFFAPIAAQKSRKQKERKEKIFVDIEQRFVDESSRRGAFRGGPRGGAGGPQNRGGRGSFNAANRGANRVNINDERAFPSL